MIACDKYAFFCYYMVANCFRVSFFIERLTATLLFTFRAAVVWENVVFDNCKSVELPWGWCGLWLMVNRFLLILDSECDDFNNNHLKCVCVRVETFINLTDPSPIIRPAHLFTCGEMSSGVSSAYRLFRTTVPYRTSLPFTHPTPKLSIHPNEML